MSAAAIEYNLVCHSKQELVLSEGKIDPVKQTEFLMRVVMACGEEHVFDTVSCFSCTRHPF